MNYMLILFALFIALGLLTDKATLKMYLVLLSGMVVLLALWYLNQSSQ